MDHGLILKIRKGKERDTILRIIMDHEKPYKKKLVKGIRAPNLLLDERYEWSIEAIPEKDKKRDNFLFICRYVPPTSRILVHDNRKPVRIGLIYKPEQILKIDWGKR
jgi:hypothetical protein